MVDRNLLREFNIDEAELDAVIAASFPEFSEEEIYHQEAQAYDLNEILTGTIVRVDNDEVVVDIGYKSEGVVQRDEWEEHEDVPEVGLQIGRHTSELQSHHDLVCRLLLEKKNKKIKTKI